MTGNGQHPAPDPRTVALGREVERIARRQVALDQEQVELDGLVRRLAEDVAVLIPAPDDDEEPAGLRSWLAADDPAEARADLGELSEWIERVYLRFSDAALPSCWAWHPAVVEELWWLRHAHRGAFEGRGASWREVGDWHDRQRPGVVRRVRVALADCDLARHSTDGDRQQRLPTAPLAQHLGQIAQHWTAHQATPTPTDQQLTDAEKHDRAQLRHHR